VWFSLIKTWLSKQCCVSFQKGNQPSRGSEPSPSPLRALARYLSTVAAYAYFRPGTVCRERGAPRHPVECHLCRTLFDILEVPQRGRTAGACRRLAKLMRELGWSPIKARGLTPGGFRDQVRGYAKDHNSVLL
jgi:hypothetical protein